MPAEKYERCSLNPTIPELVPGKLKPTFEDPVSATHSRQLIHWGQKLGAKIFGYRLAADLGEAGLP